MNTIPSVIIKAEGGYYRRNCGNVYANGGTFLLPGVMYFVL